ncbi:MAG TPA: MFS transporter, partial [Planctomycetaceae bacterium]|nr:MFS transporter [Planctomycetaceae bacterium]
MWSLSTAKRAIIVAGCLAAAYLQFSTSPATIAFARSLGANGLHIGILGALPTGMLFMQLLAAISVHYVHHRKPLWFWVAVLQRLVLLPAALGPWLWPDLPPAMWVTLLLSATATNHAMMHFTTPLWLSWMGDYLPHRGLSRYWGVRELCM